MSRSSAAAALVALCAFLYVWGLDRIPFYTKGEPREALVVWEAVHSGNWILPLRNGHEVPSKPPLFHWLGALTAVALGEVDEFSVRFPSALLATLSVLLVFWAATSKWGLRAGLYSAAILATGFEWLRAATSARVDMTLTAFLVAAFLAFERAARSDPPSPRALWAFYVCMGLAALGKGPVGILLPTLVAVAYLALRRDLGRLRQMHLAPGVFLVLVIAGSWYFAATLVGGERFLWKHLWVENVGRFLAADQSGAGHVHPWYYMIGGFLAGFAPWSAFAVPLAFALVHRRHELDARGYLYPLVWFAVPFVFYSLSESKRTVYLLPIHPAAAMLLGAWWSELAEGSAEMPPAVERILRLVAALLGVALIGAVGLLLAERSGLAPFDALAPLLHEKDRANLPLVREIVDARFGLLLAWCAVLLPVLAVFVTAAHRRRWGLVLASLVGFMASSLAVVNAVAHPEIAWRRTFKPFLAAVRDVVRPEDELVFYRAFDYGAVFYARRHIRPLHDRLPQPATDGRRTYVLLWESVWRELAPEDRERLVFLHRSKGTGPKGRDRLVLALVKPPSEIKTDSPGP
jgi:4-amino-4-deoxy-L-arabinose transferase-like glycosyltransferase